MVHALESLYAALRPRGVLLDVRPASTRPVVEVVHSGETAAARWVQPLGRIDDSYRLETLAAADAALDTLIADGRLTRERVETFPIYYYAPSVDSLLAYAAERWRNAHISAALVARVQKAASTASGEFRIKRYLHAARYRRR